MGGGGGVSATNAAVLLIPLLLLTSLKVEGKESWIKAWTMPSCNGVGVIGCGCFDLDFYRSFEYGYGKGGDAKPLEYFNERGCVCTNPSECSTNYFSITSCAPFLNVTTRGSIRLACKTNSASS